MNDKSHIKKKEKNKYSEVFTPFIIVEKMFNKLESKYPNIFKNEKLKWLDPASGIGHFMLILYQKLMNGLKNKIPNEKNRHNHIINNMIFMIEINKNNVDVSKQIFGNHANISNSNFLEDKQKWSNHFNGVNYFDIIIGNPPYNEEHSDKTTVSPLYSKFIFESILLCDKLYFLIPNKWFTTGKGLSPLRDFMLKRNDIVFIQEIKNTNHIWDDIEITGGINYFLIDKKYKDLPEINEKKTKISNFDILLTNNKVKSIINKITNQPKLNDLYFPTNKFNITTNSPYFTDNKELVKCYVSKKYGNIKYIDQKYINHDYNFWKIFTPRAAGKGNDGFSSIIIGKPNEVASQTYIALRVKNKKEAESLFSYLKTLFANFLLSLRKIDQYISEKTLSWIPLPPLDRIWTDDKLYNFYKLSNYEINLIKQNSQKIMRYNKSELKTSKTKKYYTLNKNKTKKRFE